MDDRAELYWRLYQENCTQGRHLETQRATVMTILVSVAAAALAFMRPDHLPISKAYLPLAVMIVTIGLFGAVVARKQYERFRMHMTRAAFYRNEIDQIYPGLNLRNLKKDADAAHAKNFRLFYHISLTLLWVTLYLVVAGVGSLIFWMSYTQYAG